MTRMAPVEAHRIAGQQATHHRCDGNWAGLEQQMKMIGEQSPGVTARRGLREQDRQTTHKIGTITVILKNRSSLNPPADDVMQSTGSVYAGLSWHVRKLSCQ